MLGYLSISGLDVALLLNFKEAKLQWRRVVRHCGTTDESRNPREFNRG